MNKLLTAGAIFLGVALIGLGIYYFMTPAGSLAPFIPGFEAGVTKVHFKHGLGSTILGLGLFAFAWFNSAKPTPSEVASR